MSLIPSAALADLRSLSASAMRDTCTVTRKSATAPTYNTTTHLNSVPTPTTVYSGSCRIRALRSERDTEYVGERAALNRYGATLPRTESTIEEGDILVVTASDDTQLVGRSFYVLSVVFSTDNIHRRLVLEDRQQ